MCLFCGCNKNIDLHHIDGEEENTSPANLAWACRSCSTVIGEGGRGEADEAIQPESARGAQTVAQWLTAVMSMKGESDQMPVDAAVEMIHATPAEKRSEFAKQIWALRRKRGTHTLVPF